MDRLILYVAFVLLLALTAFGPQEPSSLPPDQMAGLQRVNPAGPRPN